MKNDRTIACPHCGEPSRVDPDNAYRPFCSRRCKLIDLGDWLDESNRIPDPSGSAPDAPWDGGDSDSERSH